MQVNKLVDAFKQRLAENPKYLQQLLEKYFKVYFNSTNLSHLEIFEQMFIFPTIFYCFYLKIICFSLIILLLFRVIINLRGISGVNRVFDS